MGDRFHKAARDGSSTQGKALLKEATSRDLNRPDKEGMTPTLIAAQYGHLEAMKICIGRGGKANCSNGLGQTALHLATDKGHYTMVNFLSKYYENNFIKIIFMMDNAGMTAKQIAEDRNYQKIITLLDHCEGVFLKDSQKCQKYQNKAKKEMEKNQKRLTEMRDKAKKEQEKEINSNHKRKSINYGKQIVPTKEEDAGDAKSRKKSFMATLGKRMGTLRRKQLLEGLDFSEETDEKLSGTMTLSAGNKNVLFKGAGIANKDLTQTRKDIRDVYDADEDQTDYIYQNDYEFGTELNTKGLFTVNSFGRRAFFKQNSALTDQMENIEADNNATSFLENDEEEPLDSDEELLDSDEDPNEDKVDPLQTFLAALNLTEYWPLFRKEHMDLESLMMATDEDLIQLGLTKGPRIKILKAMDMRKSTMEKNTNRDTAF